MPGQFSVEINTLFKSCWEASDSSSAFAAALLEQGYCLARGDRRGFVAVDAKGHIYSLSRWCGVPPKELRKRLGDGADLPDVETAIGRLSGEVAQPSIEIEAHEAKLQSQRAAHDRKLAELNARQRQEGINLHEEQKVRQNNEIAARHARLPTGIKAIWAKLTGQYQHLLDDFAAESKACLSRDRDELQTLVNRHLAERRNLDPDWSFVKAQHALEQEFLTASSLAQAQIYALDPRQPLVLPLEDRPFTRKQLKAQPELILAQLSDKKARFTRTDILSGLADYISDPLNLRVAADRVLASKELIDVSDGASENFTNQDFLAVGKQLSACANEMAAVGRFKVDTSHICRAIKAENAKLQASVGANLSEEQITAIHYILAANQLFAVVGLAGAGKSTLLSVARAAWEAQGFRVQGAALAGKAADSLQSISGIKSRTLASLEASWKSGYEPVGNGDVVVIDEAGMVGTRQLARVAEQLQMRGCKLVLVGDPDQLQPIQAGTPFRDIVNENGAARLTEIRRQTSDWQRQASQNLARGQTGTALQSYADHGAVHDAPSRDQAITELVDDYMANWREHGEAKSRLALAHRRVDVHAINQAIKAARLANGETPVETLFNTDHGPRAFAPGDRILFTRNDATSGVRNGMLGTVKTVGDSQLGVRLDPDETGTCRKLIFSPKEFHAIDHGFAVSIHRSQGCTVDRSFVLSSVTLDKHLTYVALTRHKDETGFYLTYDITQ